MVAANDLFVNAQILTPGTTSVTGLNNIGAGNEPGEPTAGNLYASLWFAWFTNHNRTNVQFDTIGSGWDTYLGFYTGPKPDGTQTFAQLANAQYNDDGGGNATSLIVVPSIPANTWCYLQYGGYGGGANSIGRLNYPAPDQDWPGTVPTVSGRASAVGHLLGGTAPLIAAGVAGVATVKGVITRYKGSARLFPTSSALASPGYRHNPVTHKGGSGAGPIYGPW